MPEADDNPKVNRRALLLGVVVLLGGGAALTRFVRQGPGESRPAGPALDAEQFALLEQIVDVMIPATDTPGALAAGVPTFLQRMFSEWASDQSRADLAGVLQAIEKHAWARFGAAFVELQPERRHEVVRSFDEERVGRQDPAYGTFKFLVLAGYYHSDVGATQELRYELVPGAWRACVPYSEIGRASAV